MSKKLIAGAGVVASFAVALAPLATFAAGSYYPNTQKDTLNVTIEEICSFGHTYDEGGSNEIEIVPGKHADGAGSGDVDDVPESGIDAGKGYGKWLDASGSAVTTISAYDVAEGYQRTIDSTPTDWPETYTGIDSTPTPDTAYGVMETNTVNNAFAHTTFAVICNTDAGYQIKTSTPEDLKRSQSDTDPIAFNATYAMTGSTTSAWNFYVTDVTTTDTDIYATASAHGGAETFTNGKNAYTAAMPANNIIASATGATAKLGDRIKVTYGVSVDADQGAGTYEGSIVYTLVQL